MTDKTLRPAAGAAGKTGPNANRASAGEAPPEPLAGLREAVDQKIDDLFLDIDDDIDDEGPPATEIPDLPSIAVPKAAATKPPPAAGPRGPSGAPAAPPLNPPRMAAPPVADAPAEPPRRPAGRRRSPPRTSRRRLLWGAVAAIVIGTGGVLAFLAVTGEAPPPTPAPATYKVSVPVEHLGGEKPQVNPPTPAVDAGVASPPPMPTAAAPPVRPAAYRSGSFPYAVHAGSFQEHERAVAQVEEWRRQGLDAYIVYVDLGKKGRWHRLHIGHFATIEETMAAIGRYGLPGALVSRTRWACRVGAYPSAAEAETAARRIAERGYFPYAIVTDGTHHLFVGAHPSRTAAENLHARLLKNSVDNQIVER